METKTRSQLFPDKEYETLIDELEEGDYELKSELYKVTVFNKVIHISPGNVIKDERIATLYYCYVYVIIKDRVKAKLGVYEKMIEGTNIPEQFDLSEFDEGSMLVFDDYYKDPKRLNDFEIIEQVEAGDDNVFLYLQSKINQAPTAEDIKKHNSFRLTKLYDMLKKNKEKEADYTKMFEKYLKYFKNLEKFNDDFMEKLETSDLKPLSLMFILCILELYFEVKFIFVDENSMMINDSELRTVFNTKKYNELIVINVTTKNIVEKTDDISQLVLFKEKYKPSLAQVKAKSKAKAEVVEDFIEDPEENFLKEEGVLSDDDEEDEDEEVVSTKAKTKDRTLLAESKSSEFDTNVTTGLADPPEKSSKISFKGSEIKPKIKPESVTPLKTSSFLTGTAHSEKGKKLSKIAEVSVEESPSAKTSSVKATSTKASAEVPASKPKKSSKSLVQPEVLPPELPSKPSKSSKSKTTEVPDEVPSSKPSKSSKSKLAEVPSEVPAVKSKKLSKSAAVETKSLTPNEEAYKKQVDQLASFLPKKVKSKTPKSD